MQVTSVTFSNEEAIPTKYTCEGENISPPLMFHSVPEEARSLALVCDDPDAATDPNGPGHVWDHWVVFNIDPNTPSIPENGVPEGATVGVNSSNQNRYMGPCPPTGSHQYFFRLYALRCPLNLPAAATKQELLDAMEGHIIETAELVGTYEKEN